MRLYRAMRREASMKGLVAEFFQRRYRGWRGRLRADSRRECLRRRRMHESAVAIQASVRRRAQLRRYLDLLSERNRISNQSAAAIQALLRGKIARQMYLSELGRRNDAAVNIQREWRGAVGRTIAEWLRQQKIRRQIEASKPKRIPLHLRRYSTYGSNKRANGPKKREVRHRRRSSDAMIPNLSSLANFAALESKSGSASTGYAEPDENDSIATTITSLTNQTHATEMSSRRRRTVRANNPNSHHTSSRLPPQRLLAPDRDRRRATALHSNSVNSRRSSLDRRRSTISGGMPSSTSFSSQRHSHASRRQPSLQPCDDSEESEPNQSTASREKEEEDVEEMKEVSNEDVREEVSDPSGANSAPEVPPRRDGISTPVIVSREASLIVQEVLGKGIMSHSIVHSTFEEDLSEHEDDLR